MKRFWGTQIQSHVQNHCIRLVIHNSQSSDCKHSLARAVSWVQLTVEWPSVSGDDGTHRPATEKSSLTLWDRGTLLAETSSSMSIPSSSLHTTIQQYQHTTLWDRGTLLAETSSSMSIPLSSLHTTTQQYQHNTVRQRYNAGRDIVLDVDTFIFIAHHYTAISTQHCETEVHCWPRRHPRCRYLHLHCTPLYSNINTTLWDRGTLLAETSSSMSIPSSSLHTTTQQYQHNTVRQRYTAGRDIVLDVDTFVFIAHRYTAISTQLV